MDNPYFKKLILKIDKKNTAQVALLTNWCRLQAIFEELVDHIEASGSMVDTGRTGYKVNPAISSANKALETLLKTANQLGFLDEVEETVSKPIDTLVSNLAKYKKQRN